MTKSNRLQNPVSEFTIGEKYKLRCQINYPEHPNLSRTNLSTNVGGVIISQKPTGKG